MPLTAAGMRLIMRQLQEIEACPLADIRVLPSEDLHEVRFELDGPEGTPFQEGRFAAVLLFDEQYPNVPPKGYFRSRLFHPNVSEKGEICVNALKRDWKPDLGLRHVLLVIRCLLVEPNPESALNEEAGRLLLEDYGAYERKAAMMTGIHSRRPPGAARFAGAPDEEGAKKPHPAASAAGPESEEPLAAPHHGPSQGSPDGVSGRASCENGMDGVPPEGSSGSNASASHAISLNKGSGLRNLAGSSCNAVTNTSGKKEDLSVAGGIHPSNFSSNGGAPVTADKTKKKVVDKKKAALKRI